MSKNLSKNWYEVPALKLMWEIKQWYNANGGFDNRGSIRSFSPLTDGRTVRLAACDGMPYLDTYTVEVIDDKLVRDMSLLYGRVGKSRGKINVVVFETDTSTGNRRCLELSDLTEQDSFSSRMRMGAMTHRNDGEYFEAGIRDAWANISDKIYQEANPLTQNTFKYFSDSFHGVTTTR